MLFIFICISFCAGAQENSSDTAVIAFQNHLNSEFRDPDKSPLPKSEIKSFKALDFFPADSGYRVEAEFLRTPNEVAFEMPTTTDRKPVYIKYGEVYFRLKDREFKLNVYQGLELSKKEEYKDYLFLPFTDLTNGRNTYSGGRYLDLKIPEGKYIILDFNKAYNPYCAYSGEYSCPIVPTDNHLEIAVAAGVKAYKKP